MADVTPAGRGQSDERKQSSDRGQLLLVTGLVVAVTLVALVLILNSTIYASNLAVREAGGGDAEAVELRRVAESSVGDLLVRENRAGHASQAAVEANVTASVRRFGDLLARSYAEDARTADLATDEATLHEGARIRQANASRAFTSSDASGEQRNWTVATDTSQMRAVTATVDASAMPAVGTPEAGFHLVLDGGGQTWEAYVYESAATGELTVAVKNGTESSPSVACSTSAPNATVDFTAGTLAGAPCPGLAWATGVAAPYDVRFRFGDRAVGTYAMTVNTSDGVASPNDSALGGPGDDGPASLPAVYDVVVDFVYETNRVRYADTLRVAPGEPA